MTASIVQNQYYSERQSYSFYGNNTGIESCWDLTGALNLSKFCQEETEKRFEARLEEINPSYIIVSVFEPVFTPQWAYTYGERHNLTVVQAYSQGNQPMLVIYKF